MYGNQHVLHGQLKICLEPSMHVSDQRGEMSIRQASQAYNVPKATLWINFKLNKGADTDVAAKLGRELGFGRMFFVF